MKRIFVLLSLACAVLTMSAQTLERVSPESVGMDAQRLANADAAIEKASAATGMSILNYTAAPVFTSGTTKGHHQWLVEFAVEPDDAALQRFAKELDRCVRAENSDYDAKRTSDIFLAPLEVVAARHGLFDDWLLATSGRLGGQKKIPRLQNDRKIIEQMLTMNKG